MLEIVNLTHGQILNYRQGRESEQGLQIPVIGLARAEDEVRVNGAVACRSGESFHAEITLRNFSEKITVSADGNRGESSRSIQVLWDKKSFRRLNFCIDDHIYTFYEIAKMRPKSIFDHFYLKGLREIHEKYGLRLTLNLFFEDMRNNFTLKEFPDCYKEEFRKNSDWLKLAFHARREFPDRIYQNAEPETVLGDFVQINNEIRRFAGDEGLIAPVNVHWSMVKTSVLPELRKRGVRFLSGLFFEGQTRIGESESSQIACDGGFFENEENSLFIRQHKVWHDFRYDITMGLENMVLNLEPLPVLEQKLDKLFCCPENETLHMLTHEQYFFPFYQNYLPDHFARLELMAKKAAEAHYEFVFFNEGFLGNTQYETKY